MEPTYNLITYQQRLQAPIIAYAQHVPKDPQQTQIKYSRGVQHTHHNGVYLIQSLSTTLIPKCLFAILLVEFVFIDL